MKDIINLNSKGKLHGYQEQYCPDGKLYFKGFYNNGIQVDYEEFYNYNSKLEKGFYI
jgi:antitoxin component YwqK of YwqJK toxin-antitoxin module